MSRTNGLRGRVKLHKSWMAWGGTKLDRIKPNASKSAIHMTSLTSVLRPGAYSNEIRHLLRFKPASLSDPNLPLIPAQTCQLGPS